MKDAEEIAKIKEVLKLLAPRCVWDREENNFDLSARLASMYLGDYLYMLEEIQ